MAFVGLVNLSAINENSTLKIESSNGLIEVNPLY